MPKIDITIEICGMAGNGTIAAGGLINEAMSLGGFSVLGFDSYRAEIRGFGRCVTRSRVGSEEILVGDETHILISLDDRRSISRVPSLAHGAAVIFDNKPPGYAEEANSLLAKLEPDSTLYGVPLTDLATGAAGTARGKNLTALGVFAAIFGAPPELFHKVITKKFQAKGDKVLNANLKSFDAGYEYGSTGFADRLQPFFTEAARRPLKK